MGTIYHLNELTKIEFQIDALDVLMSIETIRNNAKLESIFQITHSELNKIMGSIQYSNPEFDIYTLLKITQIDEHTTIYLLELKDVKLNNAWVSEYQFNHFHKEIRA
ncbi:MAG: hypothetical protein ACK5B9_03930 [Flavobacteriia bacterium]|jgi:hypothetical protein